MAKTFVTDTTDDTRVPFLRGILTRSLHDSGIDFDAAYKLASEVRQQLADVEEISAEELKQRTLSLLQAGSFDEKSIEAYRNPGLAPDPIMVVDREGQASPFSRMEHIRALESCGLSGKEARIASRHILNHLLEREIKELSSSRLGHLTYVCLYRHMGREIARRYMVWVDFTHSGRPLILLIGGTTGCGKSTVATEVAHHLGVVRTQSTDMLREVMRMMIPSRLLPVLHTSAFDAWTAMPSKFAALGSEEDLIADGYRSQMELLSVPCEAVIQRALTERVPLILEGIHIHPSLLDHIDSSGDAVIVPVMLAILKRDRLKQRLRSRGQIAPKRSSRKHLSNFDRIWALQSFLLSEADRHGIPIIANDDMEKATSMVMATIVDTMESQFDATPREVFGRDDRVRQQAASAQKP
ncbi:MAG: hypothetical protein KDI63_09205 [Gammaproteobacteria bacterium]|nr:hypothetical protein [Gammaproteobacteria bacterium]